jgi:DNA-binding CsgD family transcriptional regulator
MVGDQRSAVKVPLTLTVARSSPTLERPRQLNVPARPLWSLRVSSKPHLTRRERDLLGLAGQGLTNAEIARRMGLGRPTVARILSNAMGKLGAGSRAHAVSLAVDVV